MPSDRRSLRKRTRSKIGSLKGPHSRVISCNAGCTGETPADKSHPGGSVPGREGGATAKPQAGWRASLRTFGAETRRCLLKMWVHRCLGLLLLASCALLLGLCYYVSTWSSNPVSSSEYNVWSSENADGQTPEKTSAWEALFNFFFPTTCIPKQNQVVKACNEQQDYNKTECLGYKCCYSSFKISNINCFVPLKDKPTQMFRMFGLGVIGMIILGCVPIFCCSLWRRSKWANPLGRKVNKIGKGVKKQKKKLKKDAEMLGTAAEDE
ncbi:FMR1 neighbor protein isoform X1 [Prionailurus viverrinus]|uniref:FMR1 neighbor protein isoform X1 n=1 Tax=Prionailurus viverrinus TaxID=61388 RepID=UPI001FF6C260|nr:FMR1 neighbor protein isoform X1 [Prionailurus viverrinus]XP_047700421.1 FMR1 neighbor protein isoform X1 [Prionailurus viverrinus]